MGRRLLTFFTVLIVCFSLIVSAEKLSAATQADGKLAFIDGYISGPPTLAILGHDYTTRTQIMTFPNSDLFPVNLVIDKNGNYIVTERGTSASGTHNLSRINQSGTRTVIYNFPDGTYPHQMAIDSNGNYIITESGTNTLSSISPEGVRTVIYNFPSTPNSNPIGVAIDSNGDYIVTESGTRGIADYPCRLSKITKEGQRTIIFEFDPGTLPHYVAIDHSGNYIVCEQITNLISRITPDGDRTVLNDLNDLVKEIDLDELSPEVEPGALVIDDNGDILLSVPLTSAIYRITPDGVRTRIYHAAQPVIVGPLALLPETIEHSISLNPVANRYSLCPHYLFIPVTIKANAVHSSGEAVTISAQVSCNDPAAKLWFDWTKPLIIQRTGTITLLLRAAPPKNNVERKYTITITAKDAAGNAVSENVTIVVPKICSLF